jgi:hypothetical protein
MLTGLAQAHPGLLILFEKSWSDAFTAQFLDRLHWISAI